MKSFLSKIYKSVIPVSQRNRRGFTLLELLTVMAIMVIVMSIAGASYYGLSRGAAMRGSVSNLTTALSLARQFAVVHRNKTYVKMWRDSTNSFYQVFVEIGHQMGGHKERLEVENPQFGSQASVGGIIYNKTKDKFGYVQVAKYVQNPSTHSYVTQIIATYKKDDDYRNTAKCLKWSVGDLAAWELRAKSSLAPGIKFKKNEYFVIFNSDGSADKQVIIDLIEERGRASERITVSLAGRISN